MTKMNKLEMFVDAMYREGPITFSCFVILSIFAVIAAVFLCCWLVGPFGLAIPFIGMAVAGFYIEGEAVMRQYRRNQKYYD